MGHGERQDLKPRRSALGRRGYSQPDRIRTWMLSSVTRLPLPARTPPLQLDTSERLPPAASASPALARVIGLSPTAAGSSDARDGPRRSTGACGWRYMTEGVGRWQTVLALQM